MKNICLILFFLPLFGCHHSVSIKEQQLVDTLAKLRKDFDFKPLNSEEAYVFMNKYYLPRLDSLPTNRKIFIHPLVGVDFKELFNADSVNLVKEYSADSIHKFSGVVLARPPFFPINKKFSWDNKKLIKTVVIKEYIENGRKAGFNFNLDRIKAWHKKYGYGYMCVSYPQYNAYTKRLVIQEWIENDDFCGTGRESKFWFTKTPSGWKIKDNYRWNLKKL